MLPRNGFSSLIRTGIRTIGMSVRTPAIWSNSEGVPADSSVAVILLSLPSVSCLQMLVTNGMSLGHIRPIRPPGTVAESAMIDPSGGATTVLVPSAFCTTPIWRLLFPVTTVVLPSLIVPLVAYDTTHCGERSRPSAPSIAGASTGHRVNGAHLPAGCAAAVAVPTEATVPSTVAAAVTARVSLEREGRMAGPFGGGAEGKGRGAGVSVRAWG
ncbi:hypothetical protein SF12_06010 [Streptomyces sp. MBRL 601]|nr:hypothetical protein SF12_06010 [Streptomyces sp. MBRL 601]